MGKKNKANDNKIDDLTNKKSFNWQKVSVIAANVLGIVTIVLMIIFK